LELLIHHSWDDIKGGVLLYCPAWCYIWAKWRIVFKFSIQ